MEDIYSFDGLAKSVSAKGELGSVRLVDSITNSITYVSGQHFAKLPKFNELINVVFYPKGLSYSQTGEYTTLLECNEMVCNTIDSDKFNRISIYLSNTFNSVKLECDNNLSYDFKIGEEYSVLILRKDESKSVYARYQERQVEIQTLIEGILKYSFEPINWDFDKLTSEEKRIIRNQNNMNSIKDFAYGLDA